MGRERRPSELPGSGPTPAAALVPLGLVLGVVLLALGGQGRWVALGGALACAALALALAVRRPAPLGPVAWGLVLLGGWSALQAVPLPPGLLAALSPVAAECWASAHRVLGTPEAWASISLDPGASVHEAQRCLGYAAAAAVGARVAAGHGVHPVALLVAALGTLLGAVGLVHGLLGATALYGVLTPSFPVGSFGLAPLLNPNNRAGYLALGGFAALAVALGHAAPRARPGLVALGAALLAGSAAQGSRAALAAVTLGALVLGVRVLRRRRGLGGAAPGSTGSPAGMAPGGAAVGLGLLATLALAAVALPRETWVALLAERREKLDVLAWGWPLLRDHPAVGVGRGAFGSVFPAYRQGGGHTWYTHAESFPVQWAAEWGWPVAGAALLGLLWALRSRDRRSSEWHALRVALGVLLLQNLLDLALELPAVALTAAVTLGALVGLPRAERGPPRVATAGGLFGATLAVTLLAALGPPPAGEARGELVAARVAQRPPEERLALARRHLARHPADAVVAREGALAAHAAPRGEPVPPGARPLAWAEHALVREPASGRGQLLTAELFAEGGHWVQAFLHLRLAVQHEPTLADAIARRAVAWSAMAGPGRWRAAVPAGPAGARVLARLAVQPALAEQRVALLEEALGRAPDDAALRAAALEAVVGAAEGGRAPCAGAPAATGQGCVARARALFAGGALPPEGALVLEARLRRLEGDLAGARALLDGACATQLAASPCWALRLTLSAGEGATPALEHALGARVASACGNPAACAAACTEVADVREARGELGPALELRRRAVREDPRAGTWLRLARTLARSGQASAARAAAERVVRDPAASPEERAEAVRLSATGGEALAPAPGAPPPGPPDGPSPPGQ